MVLDSVWWHLRLALTLAVLAVLTLGIVLPLLGLLQNPVFHVICSFSHCNFVALSVWVCKGIFWLWMVENEPQALSAPIMASATCEYGTYVCFGDLWARFFEHWMMVMLSGIREWLSMFYSVACFDFVPLSLFY